MRVQKSRITNSDLFLYALYRLSGAGQYVDVEDIFVELWRLAPSRFSWRKYAFPHYKVAHDAMVTIGKPTGRGQSELLLRSQDGLARQLTSRGVEWVEKRLPVFRQVVETEHRVEADRRPSQGHLISLENSRAFQRFIQTGSISLNRHRGAELLKCAPDSPRHVWRERLESLRAAATLNHRIGLRRFLDAVLGQYPEWFMEEKE